MKKLSLFLLLLSVSLIVNAQNDTFGKKVKAKNAVDVSTFAQNPEEGKNVKLTGKVESVCQAKGCWMKVKMDDGTTMRVTFKDYGFFVPKDLAGKDIVFEGIAKIKTTSVEELQHYAQDAGKSKEVIAKITQPEKALSFEADGVLIKN